MSYEKICAVSDTPILTYTLWPNYLIVGYYSDTWGFFLYENRSHRNYQKRRLFAREIIQSSEKGYQNQFSLI